MLELVALLQATSGVHDVAVVERVLKGVGIPLHVLCKSYEYRPLYVEVLVLAEMVWPRSNGSGYTESRVVVLL